MVKPTPFLSTFTFRPREQLQQRWPYLRRPFPLRYPAAQGARIRGHFHSARQPLQSSSIDSTTVVLATVCVALGASLILNTATPQSPPADPDSILEVSLDSTMAPTAQPGRPGNLTVEQEVKLQDFWKKALDVFGVAAPDEAADADPTPTDGEPIANGIPKTDTGLSADRDKKKKRKSLFGRKRKDSKIEEGAATTKAAGVPSSQHASEASDDKYGQTKEFHAALADRAPEELRRAFWSMVKGDHPDALLLRFLRARKWDADKALVMLVATMQWRAREMHVDDDVVVRGEGGALADATGADAAAKKEGEDFLAQLRLGKSFLYGTDREGRPMCTVRVRLHKQGEQTEKALERFTVHVLETARLLLVPPVDTAVWRRL